LAQDDPQGEELSPEEARFVALVRMTTAMFKFLMAAMLAKGLAPPAHLSLELGFGNQGKLLGAAG
jgi:hypothetical protein